jgi:hypothetical protein
VKGLDKEMPSEMIVLRKNCKTLRCLLFKILLRDKELLLKNSTVNIDQDHYQT